MKKLIFNLLILFFFVVFLISFWKFGTTMRSYYDSQDSYSQLDGYISYDEPAETTGTDLYVQEQEPVNDQVEPEHAVEPDLTGWPQVDFFHLSQINQDVVGWLVIEGTNINYPLVQGTDNDYYLNRLFDGTYNSAGCLFLDFRCEADFSDKHSIIYGHHMKNKSMFADLVEYKKQAFYDEHPIALLMTPDAYYKIQLFSGYVADDSANAWDLMLGDTDFNAWAKAVQKKSRFQTDHFPGEEDRVITFSTCTYEFDNAKFVVHGYISEEILLPPNE